MSPGKGSRGPPTWPGRPWDLRVSQSCSPLVNPDSSPCQGTHPTPRNTARRKVSELRFGAICAGIANFIVILSQRFAFLSLINSMALSVWIASAASPPEGGGGRGVCGAGLLGTVPCSHSARAPRTGPAAPVPEPGLQGLSGTSLSRSRLTPGLLPHSGHLQLPGGHGAQAYLSARWVLGDGSPTCALVGG